jgi:A/G-specific adenine glycosylase
MQSNFIELMNNSKDDFSADFIDNTLSDETIRQFRALIYTYYRDNKRFFAWRDCDNAYHVVVSELMLQQTQTDRVKAKYCAFITAFPTVACLAQASLKEVITLWQGLGYNRRALALHAFAQTVERQFNGVIPSLPEILENFKGIGFATAGSICAFAFNQPTVFIETNIRTVFIYCFFRNQLAVTDTMLMPLIEQTLDKHNARQWYYALMDYGVHIKKNYKHINHKSAHYSVQSKFEGSTRQIRGRILKQLVHDNALTFKELCISIPTCPKKIQIQLDKLIGEEFIVIQEGYYSLK